MVYIDCKKGNKAYDESVRIVTVAAEFQRASSNDSIRHKKVKHHSASRHSGVFDLIN